jgi:hypothetical protein
MSSPSEIAACVSPYFIRHSCASRNPAFQGFPAAVWIPACAGMTGKRRWGGYGRPGRPRSRGWRTAGRSNHPPPSVGAHLCVRPGPPMRPEKGRHAGLPLQHLRPRVGTHCMRPRSQGLAVPPTVILPLPVIPAEAGMTGDNGAVFSLRAFSGPPVSAVGVFGLARWKGR